MDKEIIFPNNIITYRIEVINTVKKYDITKKSDMNRLQRDLKRNINTQVKQVIRRTSYSYQCSCGSSFAASHGLNHCPSCGLTVTIR